MQFIILFLFMALIPPEGKASDRYVVSETLVTTPCDRHMDYYRRTVRSMAHLGSQEKEKLVEKRAFKLISGTQIYKSKTLEFIFSIPPSKARDFKRLGLSIDKTTCQVFASSLYD